MSWLVVTYQGEEVARQRLDPGAYTVGRSPTCDITIEHRALSRTHARVERRGDSVLVRDLGSQNGTFVNGQPVQKPTAVRPGDEIKIGRHLLHVEPEDLPRSAGRGMVAVITVRAEGVAPASFAVLADELVLGRTENVDITLPSPKVSRQHCRLRRAGAFFVLSDEGSQNGTFFESKRISRPVPLAPGDSFFVDPFTVTIDEQEMDLPDEEPAPADEPDAPMATAMFLGPASLRDLPSKAPADSGGRKAQLAEWQRELKERVLGQKPDKPPPLPSERDKGPAGAPPPDEGGDDEWDDATGGQLPAARVKVEQSGPGTVTLTMLSGQVIETPMRQCMMTVGDSPDCDIRLKAGDYPTGVSIVLVAAEDGNLALVHLGRGQPPVIRGLESDRALLEPGDTAVLGSFELRWDR